MPHMHDIATDVAIALQHGGDIGAGCLHVRDGEQAVVVLVLGVNDDVDAVGGGRGGRGDAEERAERVTGLLGWHCALILAPPFFWF